MPTHGMTTTTSMQLPAQLSCQCCLQFVPTSCQKEVGVELDTSCCPPPPKQVAYPGPKVTCIRRGRPPSQKQNTRFRVDKSKQGIPFFITHKRHLEELLILDRATITLCQRNRPPSLKQADAYPRHETSEKHRYCAVVFHGIPPLHQRVRISRSERLGESAHGHIKTQKWIPV